MPEDPAPLAPPGAAPAPETRPDPALLATLAGLRLRTIRAVMRGHGWPHDVLLLVADWAEQAAISARLADQPGAAEAWTQTAELLRIDAECQPETPRA